MKPCAPTKPIAMQGPRARPCGPTRVVASHHSVAGALSQRGGHAKAELEHTSPDRWGGVTTTRKAEQRCEERICPLSRPVARRAPREHHRLKPVARRPRRRSCRRGLGPCGDRVPRCCCFRCARCATAERVATRCHPHHAPFTRAHLRYRLPSVAVGHRHYPVSTSLPSIAQLAGPGLPPPTPLRPVGCLPLSCRCSRLTCRPADTAR